jgi:pimeloyl-ACP methyl ester carboxylesterase
MLNMPVFVANGDTDILVPTANTFVLSSLIKNSHLHIYPDAGHGFLFSMGRCSLRIFICSWMEESA